METKDLAELIKSRRSIRVWQDKPVSEKLLSQAIELATYAPNAGNQQNWHFYVILNRDKIKAIADAVQDAADYVAAWPEAANYGELALRIIKNSAFFRSAPAAIAITTSKYESAIEKLSAGRKDTDPRARQIYEWRHIANSAIQSVGSGVAYLLLILHQMGLGAVWMTGPMQAKGQIEKILGMPAGSDLVAFIPVGYPAENPAPRGRKPVTEVCEVIK
jgi:nitroreductase